LQIPGISCWSGAIDPVVTIADSCNQAITIAGAVEGAQVCIDAIVVCRSLHDYDTSAIVRIVEIWVIPAVPHKIAVPGEIGVAESYSHSIIRSIDRITISESHGIIGADGDGRIVGIVSVVVVKIRPAGFILGFHPNVVITGGRAIVFTVGAGAGFTGVVISCLISGSGSRYGSLCSRRIIYVIWCLCRLSGRRATAHQDKTNGQEG
jgi:hypothetical protein